jgi:hypothetical protein
MPEILSRFLGDEITGGEEEKKPWPKNKCLFFFVNIGMTAAPKRLYARGCVRVGMQLHLMEGVLYLCAIMTHGRIYRTSTDTGSAKEDVQTDFGRYPKRWFSVAPI